MKSPLAAVVITACMATGCASLTGPSQTPAAGPAAPTNLPRPSAESDASAAGGIGAELPSEPTVTGASAALIDLSREQRESGNLSGAAATIERALSIEPDQALLWVELAEIRLNQGDRALAEEMAQKALTLTSANSATAARARRLIRR
jgi:Flp pilus assembly protein TadD